MWRRERGKRPAGSDEGGHFNGRVGFSSLEGARASAVRDVVVVGWMPHHSGAW